MRVFLLLLLMILFSTSTYCDMANADEEVIIKTKIKYKKGVRNEDRFRRVKKFDPCENLGYEYVPESIREICRLKAKLKNGRKFSVILFHVESSVEKSLVSMNVYDLLKREFGRRMNFYTANVRSDINLRHYLSHKYFSWDGTFANASIGVIDCNGYLIQKFTIKKRSSIQELERKIGDFLRQIQYYVVSREEMIMRLRNRRNPTILFFVRQYSPGVMNITAALEEVAYNWGTQIVWKNGVPMLRKYQLVFAIVNSEASSLYPGLFDRAILQNNMAAFGIFNKGRKVTELTQIAFGDSFINIADDIGSKLYHFQEDINQGR